MNERRTVMLREVDWSLWVAFRAEAIGRRWTTARMFETILREWFAAQRANREEEAAG